MRFAVIADIHGNAAALRAVLEDIARRGVDGVLNLGDSLCGPLDPVGTAAILMERDDPTIAGNHDRWLIDRPPEEQPLWEQWTYPLLDKSHFDWVRALPATRVVEGVLMTHGTPESDSVNWLHVRADDGGLRGADLWETAGPAKGLDHPVILSGHTHMPRAVRLPDGRLLVNPGAVGCPAYLDDRHDPPFFAEQGTPDALYAIIEQRGGTWSAALHQVPYDPSAMIAAARKLGAESWAGALATGWARPEPG